MSGDLGSRDRHGSRFLHDFFLVALFRSIFLPLSRLVTGSRISSGSRRAPTHRPAAAVLGLRPVWRSDQRRRSGAHIHWMLSVAAAVVLAWAASAVGTPGLRASAATDPVIAAAGDIACDPANSQFNNGLGGSANCRQKYTSDLLVNMNPAAVLDLGDNQYYCGGYQAFLQSYDLSWGRLKSITHPSVGNHEYITSGGTGCDSTNGNAAGYFKYFGALAGTTGQGWYSYDIGAWHIIALNSNCGDIGGCGSGTAEYQWLQSDLAAHPAYCTLAYWHIPLFSSGGRAAPNSQPLWQLLYNSQADVILNGHDHVYERFAPQDPTGAADLPRGLREFIVGTGGADHTSFPLLAANSELRNANTFGVLKLTLHSTSYDWQFVPEAGYTFTDTGTNNCHDNVPDTTPPSAPSNFAATTVAYNQVGLTWTASKDNVAVTGYRVFRNNVQLASTSGRSYVDTTVQAQTGYSYYVTAFDAAGLSSAQSNTVAVTTPPAASALVFGPADDSYVQSDQPATNFGAGSQVVVDNSPVRHTYLKFNVSGLGTQSILSARLRLYCVDGSPFGGEFHRVADSTWSQGTLTWNNAPAADAAILGSLGTVAPGTWYEVDVTSLVTGNGTYSIEGQSSSTDGAYYSSNEGTAGFAPQLVVTLSASGTVTPTPTTTATPTNTPTATSTGTVTGSLLFSDGFETGSLSPQWSTVQGLVVQNQEVASGSFAARGTSAGAGAAYARTTLSSAQSDLYYRIRFKVLSLGANTVNLLKFRTAADGSILSLSITNTGMLSYRNDVTGIANNSTLAVSPGAWQTLQAHVRIAGTAGLVEVWYNDAPVSALTRTESLGTNPVGRLQLGENTTGLTYDIAFDDAGVSLAYIGSSPALTPTFTPTATATPSSIATSTNTPTATPTATSTPTAGPTATPTFTPTATPTASSGVAAFAPEADTYVLSSQPTINFATNTSLRADGSPDMHSYARFAVAGLNGAPITRVTLLFFITSGSSSTLQARAVSDTAWGEKAVTYNNAPVMGGTIATSGVLATGTWISLDVTGYVTAEGAYSFGIITPGSTAVAFGSRESTAAPRLIVETAQ